MKWKNLIETAPTSIPGRMLRLSTRLKAVLTRTRTGSIVTVTASRASRCPDRRHRLRPHHPPPRPKRKTIRKSLTATAQTSTLGKRLRTSTRRRGGPDSDPHGLDSNGDGIACESLPGSPTQASSTPSATPTETEEPDRNCSDFDTWSDAQAFYEAEGGPDSDPHGLDSNGDGTACESLPGSPTQASSTPSATPTETEEPDATAPTSIPGGRLRTSTRRRAVLTRIRTGSIVTVTASRASRCPDRRHRLRPHHPPPRPKRKTIRKSRIETAPTSILGRMLKLSTRRQADLTLIRTGSIVTVTASRASRCPDRRHRLRPHHPPPRPKRKAIRKSRTATAPTSILGRDAQDFFLAAGGPDSDPHGLDSNGDGIACESLPGSPTQASSTPSATPTETEDDSEEPDRNCSDFDTWQEAQDFYEAAGGPDSDPHGLDGNGDGIACESLPGSPTQASSTPKPDRPTRTPIPTATATEIPTPVPTATATEIPTPMPTATATEGSNTDTNRHRDGGSNTSTDRHRDSNSNARANRDSDGN